MSDDFYSLAPRTEPSVAGRLEGVFPLLLFRCRQPNPSHLCQPLLIRHLRRGYRKKDTKSSDACMGACQKGA
jgi:hypothetical protein